MVEIQCVKLNREMQDNVSGHIISKHDILTPEATDLLPIVRPLITNNALLNYISFDGNGIDLNDSQKEFFTKGDYAGFISSDVSDENCNTPVNDCVSVGCKGDYLNFDNGITISFYGDCCSELTIQYVYPDTHMEEEILPVTGDLFHFQPGPWYSDCITSIRIYFSKSKLPNQFVKVSYIKFGEVTIFKKIKDINLLEEINVLSDDLPINSLDFSVVSQELLNFQDNAPLNVYSNGKYYGTFYVDDAERTAKNIYSVKTLNNIKKLDEVQYKEWSLATNFALFKKQLETLTNIEISCFNENFSAFGNIPINSCRYALCQFAFACRLMIDGSRNDSIVLKQIPEAISSVILTKDKRIIGNATYTKSKPITTSKFQYALGFNESQDTIQINNPANERILYYFNEPVQLLSQQPEGVTIYAHADNYVDFSSTQENVALNVYKIGYTYHNADIINDFATKSPANEKDFSKLNLRGVLFDENGAGTQLPEYKANDIKKYMQSGGVIKAKIVLENERVGDLIQIETAFDGIKTGIITSMAISFGYREVAEIEVLEWPI